MQHELNHTVQELMGARGLDEVSRNDLSALVSKYPYSAVLHLLYSKKLQLAQDPRYGDSVARTALYFSNPHWLHHLLRPKTSRQALQEMEEAFTAHAQDTTPEPAEQTMAEQSPALPEPEMFRPDAEPELTEVLVPEPGGEKAMEMPVIAENSQESEADLLPELESENQELTAGAAAEDTDQPFDEGHSQANGEEAVTYVHPSEEVQEGLESTAMEEAAPAAEWQAPDIRPLEAAPEMPDFGLPPIDTAETEKSPYVAETVSSEPLPSPIPEAVLPSGPVAPPAETGLIPLEPYYTIDYFASQGIQLSEEEKQDQLGSKLKRFTAWLKTMKKIHPDKSRPVIGGVQSEDHIREGAEHSNDLSEVITEAMAEVYLKQGLKEKALEIYRKLSLLEPSRSTTFAAKIAELNTPDT
jgi:hypothetical protein